MKAGVRIPARWGTVRPMSRVTRSRPAGWHTEHHRDPDGAIASTQWVVATRAVVPAGEEGARALGTVYWRAVESTTLGIVRARRAGSDAVELRIGGRGRLLLRLRCTGARRRGGLGQRGLSDRGRGAGTTAGR